MADYEDTLDSQVHRFCGESTHIMPSPKVYGEVRKMVLAVGWDETKRLISEVAKEPGVISVSAVALTRVSRKQAAGEFAPKSRVAAYRPVTNWRGG